MILFYDFNCGSCALFSDEKNLKDFLKKYANWCIDNDEAPGEEGEDYRIFRLEGINPNFDEWINLP